MHITDFPQRRPSRPHPTRRRTTASLLTTGALLAATVTFAAGAGAGETVWDRVAECESGGNWSINTGNGYYGGLQFYQPTWVAFGGKQYAAYAHQASKAEQIDIAQEVLKVQGPGAWPVCSVRAGLTVENGLAVDPWGDSRDSDRPSRDGTRSVIPLVVDGIRGPMTNSAIEMWVDGSVNGSLSTSDVQHLQGEVGTSRDGIIGPITTSALQRRVGATVDGIWGPQTTTYLQRYLNRILG